MASQQFNDGLIMTFGIAGALLLFYALIITVGMPIAIATSSEESIWATWAALPALWLGGLFIWIANKLDD